MKEIIKAIHSSEIEDLIKKIGLLERFKAEEIRCNICGDTIKLNNFKAITRRDGQIVFLCNKEKCFSTITNKK